MRISGRRLDKAYDRVVRIIGVMKQDVMFSDVLEDVRHFRRKGHALRRKWLKFQVTPGSLFRQGEHARKVNRARSLEYLPWLQTKLAGQWFGNLRGCGGLNFQPNHIASA